MKRTFTTVMPDQIGAFLKADQCVSEIGLNITRVSYNKAIDVHMLFIEVEGTEQQLDLARDRLEQLGYLDEHKTMGNVVLLEFKLQDKPGTLLPILQLIAQYNFNITYISSQENETDHQYFKMGLFVEDGEAVSQFMAKAALLCPIRVLEYNKHEKILDNTVFYLNFAEGISRRFGLGEEEKRQLILQSNRIMQMLDERNQPPHKTFEYIGLFADLLQEHKGEGFHTRVSWHATAGGYELLLMEPPCGSNVCVIFCKDKLLFVDCGFACYRDEMWAALQQHIPGLQGQRKELILTHADVDHTGCVDDFDRVYANAHCYRNFEEEYREGEALREENPLHAPYYKISKFLSGYHPPKLDRFTIIGNANASGDQPLLPCGTLEISGLCFELYEGQGGHVKGEMVFVERKQHLVFTGDIFVNIKGFSRDQAEFNRLAPYLMTSVDSDPALARRERDALWQLLDPGEWLVFCGHGAAMKMQIPQP